MMCFGLKDRKRLNTNHCVIVLLDDTQLVHELHASSSGQDLLDVVIKHLNLLETSYFGLRYFPNCNDQPRINKQHQSFVWLDVERSAIKQLRNVQPMTVYFGVKYYAPDPCKLAEEITRYQFFLQCKQDILHGRLPIPFDLAIELFALAVQSELGDYDPQRHQEGYVGEFQFLPANQTLELERRVALFHRNLTGQVPATAELNFLERVKWLDLYGCDLHLIQYDEDNRYGAHEEPGGPGAEEYALGLNPSGVSVLRNKLKVAHYVWSRIVKTKCQGRCFLMDVMGNLMARGNNIGGPAAGDNNRTIERQRFGFRLADKMASRRLRQSLEQHKSFYHLINNSATLNQLALANNRQHQRQKLSQRFRHSIRSAIHLGAASAGQSQLMHHQQQIASQQQQHQQQQQRQQQQQLQLQQRMQLRSSMKSGQYLDTTSEFHRRQQPTVVRMPSRRYGRQSAGDTNNNGLPLQHSHTMLDHQRQQALMMMSKLNQPASLMMAAKSQTLKPMSSSSAAKQAAANREKNQYYHQMMMAMMASQHKQEEGGPAILAPGRHVLHQQPNIYKATSVINGINQLGSTSKEATMMQQLFNTRPQYPSARGHESPRSTKSAIAPGSALRLASKKLAKQQQQLLFGGAPDVQPLLALDPMQQQQQQMYSNYYGLSTAYNVNHASANVSPRSARSARITDSTRHKSRSTNENLHLLHNVQPSAFKPPPPPPTQQQQHQSNNNKMLLATATQLMQQHQQLLQRPPPPNYNGNIRSESRYSDNESELSKTSAGKLRNRKRATFALTNEQANILLSSEGQSKFGKKRNPISGPDDHDEDADDYCCSRSDCSSIDENPQQSRRKSRLSEQQKQTKSSVVGGQQDWSSIRRRHGNFGKGKAFHLDETALRDANNNASSQLVKNIANKQATPILLSMNFDEQHQPGGLVNNSKAIQLLNLQRQQLNSSSTSSGQSVSPEASKMQSCTESASSSATSSPKQQQQQQQQQSNLTTNKTKADSTVSNSTTTSGYYAGSNSTGSASADSDSQQPSSKSRLAGSRAKIALGSYTIQSRMSGDRLLIGNQAHLKTNDQTTRQLRGQQKHQFYLGDPSVAATAATRNNNSETKAVMDDNQENWQQHQPSSLKYVSFDV